MNLAVPNIDGVLLDDEVRRLNSGRQRQRLGWRSGIGGVELQDAVVDLIEDEDLTLIIRGERLRAVVFGVLAAPADRNADRAGSFSSRETAKHRIRGLSGADREKGAGQQEQR